MVNQDQPTMTSDPGYRFAAVTTSDTVYIRPDGTGGIPTRGLWVGGAGTLTVVGVDGVAVLFSGVPAGTLLPLRVKRVNATGTTATLIVAIF